MIREAIATTHITPIDEQVESTNRWGYTFGVDGVVDFESACEMFGGISRQTMDRRAEKQLIRKGKDAGRIVFCVRSIRRYLASTEV